ncbi:hypothetical protein CYLTODRAFT_246276 [Cylindrobasidium torrendii FP15055 ss-10]|uniref:Uncharacterized protein n=1 Tax=Cylindrobasidium torrendii FP15055 ss-10 TaxID=1314674 RepID=A0A0D7BEK0_9AGAR|nr:hypothetical protein CYLTODRAFT_246276 [Cylindrobasidium torrendii FP15055 ss-10]
MLQVGRVTHNGVNFMRLKSPNIGGYADEPSIPPEPTVGRYTRLAPWYELAQVKCPQLVAQISPPTGGQGQHIAQTQGSLAAVSNIILIHST